MNKKYIYQHLGLGDHIVCNGLIREIAKKETTTLFIVLCKNIYKDSVTALFKDIVNICIQSVPSDDYVRSILARDIRAEDFIKIGHFIYNNIPKNLGWDEYFYQQHNIDFKKRWESFYVERNRQREDELFTKLNNKNEPYILIHGVGSNNVDRLNYSKIPLDIKHIHITPLHTSNIVDYYSLIEQAKEIHCIDSFFHHLVDSIECSAALFYHDKHDLQQPRNIIPHRISKSWILV